MQDKGTSLATALSWSTNVGMGLILPYFVNWLSNLPDGLTNVGWVFITHGCFNLIAGFFALRYVIETMGKTNSEIMKLYAEKGGWTEADEQGEQELLNINN